MTDMVAWLLERIAEDERIARRASGKEPGSGPAEGEHWHWVHTEEGSLVDQTVDLADDDDAPLRTDLRSVERYPTTTVGPLPHFAVAYAEAVEHRVAIHVAAWDPARVLAECESKRRLIASVRLALQFHPAATPYCPNDERCACRECLTIRSLSLPYVDHPDFPEEWRPTSEEDLEQWLKTRKWRS